jgi:hypothetical protein
MIAAVVERCAGIDVGKKFLKVCVMVGPLAQEPRFEIRQIDCSDAGYRKLREWLKAEQVTHAVMESTGTRRKPKTGKATGPTQQTPGG